MADCIGVTNDIQHCFYQSTTVTTAMVYGNVVTPRFLYFAKHISHTYGGG